MGNRPSAPSAEQRETLESRAPELHARAACAIRQADILVVSTGAGWSADSGLAVYRDVADVPAYHERNLTYRDICQPHFLDSEPALFHGFWGGCYNDYREVEPHEGYRIVRKWVERKFRYTAAAAAMRKLQESAAPPPTPTTTPPTTAAAANAEEEDGGTAPSTTAAPSPSSHAGAFFAYTSNVDAHWHTAGFGPNEVHEIHGNVESWQCAERCVSERWPAPPGHRFRVDATSRLCTPGPPLVPAAAPVGTSHAHDAGAFADNWPACVACGGPARPAVLMFGDSGYQADVASEERWEAWQQGMAHLAKSQGYRVAILEVGCGGNVTSVRMQSEAMLEELSALGVTVSLVRVNPELPLADQPHLAPLVLPLLSTGLKAVRILDALLESRSDAPPGPTATTFVTPFVGYEPIVGGSEEQHEAMLCGSNQGHAGGAAGMAEDDEDEEEEDDEAAENAVQRAAGDVTEADLMLLNGMDDVSCSTLVGGDIRGDIGGDIGGGSGGGGGLPAAADQGRPALATVHQMRQSDDAAARAKLDALRNLLKGVDTELTNTTHAMAQGAEAEADAADGTDTLCAAASRDGGGGTSSDAAMSAWERFALYPAAKAAQEVQAYGGIAAADQVVVPMAVDGGERAMEEEVD